MICTISTSTGRGAAAADGIIHLAFIHDFANYAASAEANRTEITAMAAARAGSNKPLVVTSGTAGVGTPGTVGTENEPAEAARRFSEAALEAAPPGVRGIVVRLAPTVHGDGDHGFVPQLIHIAREHGVWIGGFFSLDKPVSSAKTRGSLGWEPTHVGLLDDLARGTYFD